jgi:hypothetical protein
MTSPVGGETATFLQPEPAHLPVPLPGAILTLAQSGANQAWAKPGRLLPASEREEH